MAGADPLEPSMEAYVRLAEVPRLWIFGLPRERGVNLYRMKAMYFEVYLLQQPLGACEVWERLRTTPSASTVLSESWHLAEL